MNTNNPTTIIQALNIENSRLKKHIGTLLAEREQQVLFDKLLCAALTGTCSRGTLTTKEAAQLAMESTQAMIQIAFGKEEECKSQ